MQYYTLDPEEIALLKDFEEGTLKPVNKSETEQKKYQTYTNAHFTKTKNVNIRLAERDLLKLKAKALEEGIPYQTLMTSILHKYVGGKLHA